MPARSCVRASSKMGCRAGYRATSVSWAAWAAAALFDSQPLANAATPLWGRFQMLSTTAQGPEHVVVAGGSVVDLDDGQQVGTGDAARGDVEAAAHALPRTAPDAEGTAVRTVV